MSPRTLAFARLSQAAWFRRELTDIARRHPILIRRTHEWRRLSAQARHLLADARRLDGEARAAGLSLAA